MMYLSRGLPVTALRGNESRISLYGQTYALGPMLTSLWNSARYGPKEVSPCNQGSIRRMAQSGLVVMEEDTSGKLAAYRLLSQCILCPNPVRIWRPLVVRDRRLWTWISGAGLRLTTCELIRLEEQSLLPVPTLLGDAHRRALVDAIYMHGAAKDSLLSTAMEHSPMRDATISSLLRLLRGRYLFLT